MTNKPAGFWSKLLSRILDILPVATLTVATAFLVMKHTPVTPGGSNTWHFEQPYTFYLWGLLLIALLLLTFIIIPLLTKGQTIGQMIMRIKVVAKEGNISQGIMKRELFFAWTWIFTSVLVIAIINHTLITKYAATDQSKITFTSLESLRIGIVSSVGSIGMICQMIIGISVLVRKDKTGFHDRYAKTIVVCTKKFIKVEEVLKTTTKKAKPIPSRDVPVEWIK